MKGVLLPTYFQTMIRFVPLFFLTFLTSCSTFSDADRAFRNEYGIVCSTDYAMRFLNLKKKDILKWYINGEEGSPWDYAK